MKIFASGLMVLFLALSACTPVPSTETDLDHPLLEVEEITEQQVGDQCTVNSPNDGWVMDSVLLGPTCIEIGQAVPDTDCVVSETGTCTPLDEIDGPTKPVVGDQCTVNSPNDGWVMDSVLLGPTCIEIGQAVPDTDCVVSETGTCESLS